ncbi:hypothetical protein F2Q69_00034032 [Brassica cretica]|uniref:Uncharacterized protein n=1 Tax=Brassica cretica TaxID=69181 RepID=A0A8S9SU68_BRACR|nr:hypothetical protein F2Q69_00034032 [Brassica cretica]
MKVVICSCFKTVVADLTHPPPEMLGTSHATAGKASAAPDCYHVNVVVANYKDDSAEACWEHHSRKDHAISINSAETAKNMVCDYGRGDCDYEMVIVVTKKDVVGEEVVVDMIMEEAVLVIANERKYVFFFSTDK